MRRSTHRYRGTFSAFFVVIIVSLISLAGLVLDGGRMVATYLEISDDAQNAGRVGVQHITNIRAGQPRIDPERAHREMSDYLQQRGHNSSVFVSESEIVVEIRSYVPTTVLQMFGVRGRTVTVRRTVQAVAG
jgi:hypothetical protein